MKRLASGDPCVVWSGRADHQGRHPATRVMRQRRGAGGYIDRAALLTTDPARGDYELMARASPPTYVSLRRRVRHGADANSTGVKWRGDDSPFVRVRWRGPHRPS